MSSPEDRPVISTKDEPDVYYENTKDYDPSKNLVEVTEILGHAGAALDLGCGSGRDTRYLVRCGYDVTAIDLSESVREYIEHISGSGSVNFVRSSFEDYDFPVGRFEIVNASFTLPFVPPEHFDSVFQKMLLSLKPGGVFVGQLFGDRDEWNVPGKPMTFHTREQVEQLFVDLKLLKIEEIDDPDSQTANGTPKHWHRFNIIAQKE